MDPPEQHSGSMVLRAWLEDGRLRVRVLSSLGNRQATPLAVTSVHAVQAAVLAWLTELQRLADD